MSLGPSAASNPNLNKLSIQLTCDLGLMNLLKSQGVHYTRVDPFLKKEVTDFMDTMLKQKIVFLDINLSNWEKAIKVLLAHNVDKILLCAEDFSVHESLKAYLAVRGAGKC